MLLTIKIQITLLYHYFFQLAVMTQGVYCFHTQTHTYYQFTEEGVDKGSDEFGSVLYDWICNAKLREKKALQRIAHLGRQLQRSK